MTRKKSFFLLAFVVPIFALALSSADISSLLIGMGNGRYSSQLVGVAPKGPSENTNLETVRQKIKEKGAKWEASETSVSRLSPEERKTRVVADGLRLSTEDTPRATPPVKARAPKLDWRNNNGNYVTPVKDQGSCGSCWAFSTTATAESANMIHNKTPYTQSLMDLSEQVMLSCSGAGTCNGGMPSAASYFIKSTGLPAESCLEYSGTDGNCAAACENWQANTTKIGQYVFTPGDVTSIKNALASYGPISTTFFVYDDFYYYDRGVYSYTTGAFSGAHAVMIVGYDDSTKSFLVKNSWGPEWGENGFFRIAYTEMNSVVGFGRDNLAYSAIVPDELAPTINITNPVSGAVLEGMAMVDMDATDNIGVTKVELYANGQLVATDSEAPYSISWNTYSVANGSVILTANAYDAHGNVGFSEITVSVNNAPDTVSPEISILSPANGSTVSGTVTLNAMATDNKTAVSMEAFIDGRSVAVSNSGSLTYAWSVKKSPLGPHIIKVLAKDGSGNTSEKSITIYYRR